MLAGFVTACRPGAEHGDRGAVLTVDTVPEVEIQATAPGGAVQFGDATGGLRLSDGRLAIIDESDETIRLFDGAGSPAGEIGRRGKGPGEFVGMDEISPWQGDSIAVFDRQLQRRTVFGRDGGTRIATTGGTVLATLSASSGGLELGMTEVQPYIPTAATAGRLVPASFFLIHGSDTTLLLDTLPVYDPRPGGRWPATAVAGHQAYLGLTDSAFVTVWDTSGARASSFRVTDDPQPSTQEEYDHEVDAMKRLYPGLAGSIDQMLRGVPRPGRIATYHKLYGAPDGTLWVLVTAPTDSVVHLRAFSPDGARLGEIRLPFELRIFQIGNDYIMGLRENDLGEQRVVVYPIRRTAGGSP